MKTYNGYQIKLSNTLVEKRLEVRNRTWRERLFSWPWRPLQAQQVTEVFVPSSQVFLVDDRTLVMHPATYARFAEGISKNLH